MVQETSIKNPTQAHVDALHAVFDVANAQQEAKVKSLLAKGGWKYTPKTREEEDAEDADLFAPQIPNLGLGFPIPKQFLDGDVKRKDISSNDKLRQLITGKKGGFQASKPRDAQEKAGSAKRGLREESSDEEEGRSGLGKAKKAKTSSVNTASTIATKSETRVESQVTSSNVKPIPKVGTGHVVTKESNPLFKTEPKAEPNGTPLPGPKKLKNVTKKKALVDYPSEDEDESTASTKKAAKSNGPPGSEFDIPDDSENPPARPLGAKIEAVKQSGNSKTSSTTSGSDSDSELDTAIPTGLTSDVIPATTLSPSRIDGKQKSKAEKNRLKKLKKREREKKAKAAALTSAAEK
jgi:hypothetical protein